MSQDIRNFFLKSTSKNKPAGKKLEPVLAATNTVEEHSFGRSSAQLSTKLKRGRAINESQNDSEPGHTAVKDSDAELSFKNVDKKHCTSVDITGHSETKQEVSDVLPSSFFSNAKINQSTTSMTVVSLPISDSVVEKKSTKRLEKGRKKAATKTLPDVKIDVEDDMNGLNDQDLIAALEAIDKKYAIMENTDIDTQSVATNKNHPTQDLVTTSLKTPLSEPTEDFSEKRSASLRSTEVLKSKTPKASSKKAQEQTFDRDEMDSPIPPSKTISTKRAAEQIEKLPSKQIKTAMISSGKVHDAKTLPSAKPDVVDTPIAPVITPKKSGYAKFMARQSAGPRNSGSRPLPVGADNCLTGLAFVFTGEMPSFSREDATDLVKRYGGRVVGAPSSKTSYVVVGEDPGESKLKKVRDLKLKVLDEDSFVNLISSTFNGASASTVTLASPLLPVHSAQCTTPVLTSSMTPVSSTINHLEKDSFIQLYNSMRADVKTLKHKESRVSHKTGTTTQLWVDKYKPISYSEVIGNKGLIEKLSKWLKNWESNRQYGFPKDVKDDSATFRACLLSGSPGLGKTTSAHLVARLEDFDVVEFNASDVRSKKALDNLVKESTGTVSIASLFGTASSSLSKGKSAAPVNHKKRGRVLIMDEVDGMSAGDRGGSAELISIIKQTKIPIICICNDRSSPKIRSLANHCFDLRFRRPDARMISARVEMICKKEGLDISPNVIAELVDSTSADIRQILNILSTYKLTNNRLTYDEAKTLSANTRKNSTMSPFDIIGKLLSHGSYRNLSFGDMIDLYFHDYSMVPLMVHENYLNQIPSLSTELRATGKQLDLETVRLLSEAADSISMGDLVESVQRSENSWSLLPLHAVMSTIRPCFFAHGRGSLRYNFASWLGQNSKQAKAQRFLREIQIHMRLRTSADKNQVCQCYLPTLAQLLTRPLSNSGTDGITEVIRLMDEYYLSKDDFDAIMELGYSKLISGVATSTKTAFTRIYNKMNHPKATMDTVPAKSVGKGHGSELKPDMEEIIDVEDQVLDDDASDAGGNDGDDAISNDRSIKIKKTSTGKNSQKNSKSLASESSRGGKSARGSRGGRKK
ncbi:hypothetical protein BDV3_006321 [Batrachochytrium dendrobatidis]